ncbi:MAG: DUF1501 domain-containing protein [Planctomycetota bacterium]
MLSKPFDLASAAVSRRAMLAQCGYGIGMLGLASVLEARGASPAGPLVARPPHFPAKAKRIIHLWMNGGPSQVDTFDPKPALARYAGQRPASTARLSTERQTGGLLPSPFAFTRHGQSGIEISEIFPHIAKHADDLCVIRSMYTNVPVHEASNWMMFTGNVQPIRPSYGSWLLYGLGTENQNLPGFIVLGEGTPVNGPSNWSSRFLPGIYQGCQVAVPRDYRPSDVIPNLSNRALSPQAQRRELDFTQELNAIHRDRLGAENALNARIESLELAFRMQTSASEAFDISTETASTQNLYGLTGENANAAVNTNGGFSRPVFARNCLLARRLVERGVRVVQIYCGNLQPWDTHNNNAEGHRGLAQLVDRPIGGLLHDLKQRGLLEDTLVVWGGEFGRTPASEQGNGRDHNHYGFSIWMAGGGVKPGLAYGATDEFGFRAVDNRMHVHDLHATMLHLMGIDHERLTYRYSGRDYRLTDVHGRVVHDVLA